MSWRWQSPGGGKANEPEAGAIVLPGLVEEDEEADKVQQDHQDGGTQSRCHGAVQDPAILALRELLVDLQRRSCMELLTEHV